MDLMRAKSKKRQLNLHDKPKQPTFTADLKTIKENMKIKEILRTVKINSSMRIKAPRGSKVMSNKDLTEANDSDSHEDVVPEKYASNPEISTSLILDNEDLDKLETDVDADIITPADASGDIEKIDTNSDLKIEISDDIDGPIKPDDAAIASLSGGIRGPIEIKVVLDGVELPDQLSDGVNSVQKSELSRDTVPCLPIINNADKPLRVRKLSLDQTMLSRRASSLSQSEVDLHTIGKLPLERKSSFFRKKMENFVENTSKIFKRQSMTKADGMQRRGSMSHSLQSLNDQNNYPNQYLSPASSQDLHHGSVSSLNSVSTVGNSGSSQYGSTANSTNLADQVSLSGSQSLVSGSPPVGLSESVHSLNEAYIQEQMLCSRAISMSSGLDTASETQKRRSSRAKRVTWLASEGLTNYLRRVIQDETSKEDSRAKDFKGRDSKGKDIKTDGRGRRLSYQRAVSGEDPVRYSDSSLRRRRIPEHSVANHELVSKLSELSRDGVPPLKNFVKYQLSADAARFLCQWAQVQMIDLDKLQPIPNGEEARQAVVRELVKTEADYVMDLTVMVESYMAAAHTLQDSGHLLNVDTEQIYHNLPDVYNASLEFWEKTIVPMLADAEEREIVCFNTDLMLDGFVEFREIFRPYDQYLRQQHLIVESLKSLCTDADFVLYCNWCQELPASHRLTLSDMLVKPMQRLTKYGLLLARIAEHTEAEPSKTTVMAMETFSKNHVQYVNRSIRQRQELDKLQKLVDQIEPYEVEFKDEDMDRLFKSYSGLNLQAPMLGCLPHHSRSIIHDVDVRYKDNLKEFDARAILLTDMLLILKKQSRGSIPYKLVRPKYMLDRLKCFGQITKNKNKDLLSLMFILVDEVGSAQHGFTISDPTGKDNNAFVRQWDGKVREAKLTYELGLWCARDPAREVSEVDYDSSAEHGGKTIEKDARQRVAAMLHRSLDASTEYDFSQTSMQTDSFDVEKLTDRRDRCELCISCDKCRRKASERQAMERVAEQPDKIDQAQPSGSQSGTARTPTFRALRHTMQRHSTSSRNSRWSSFHRSISAFQEHDPQPVLGPSRFIQWSGSAEVHPYNPTDGKTVTKITINLLSASDSEAIISRRQYSSSRPSSRRSSSTHPNTLRVQPQDGVMALMHSLPDLTIDPTPYTPSTEFPQTASGIVYQSHQEMLNRNRMLVARSGHYLTPDCRGTSYPPPGPSRASLRRSMAVSQSYHHPPLHKMGHVNSQSSHLFVEGQSHGSRPPSAASAKSSSSMERSSTSGKKKGPLTKQQMKQIKLQLEWNRRQMQRERSQEREVSPMQPEPSTSASSPLTKTKSVSTNTSPPATSSHPTTRE